MSGRLSLVSSTAAAAYDLGEGHPMRGLRVGLTLELAAELGVMGRPGWNRTAAPPATLEQLAGVHSREYIAMVRAADRLPARMLAVVGIGTEDTPLIPLLHESAAAVVGASLRACEDVWSGRAVHAVNLTGGLHHAMAGHASGFCVYNDAAVAITQLLAAGCRRVAYVDLDAHHGDGVESAFAGDERVLTLSVHQDGETLFPGSGRASDVGLAGAEGSAVNVALPPGTGDSGWLRALGATAPVLLRSFRPELIVTQCGCDGHRRDPLSDLCLTVEGFTEAYRLMHQLAHELCAGRWVVLGGGGYDLGSAVPRAWTQLLAVVSGGALPADTLLPDTWRRDCEHRAGRTAPRRLGDGSGQVTWTPWDAGTGDPGDPLDRAVSATRWAVLPLHGLDPFVDR